MFDIAFFILFFNMAYRIAKAINLESNIFLEFNQSRSLAFLVLLFPFGSVAIFVGTIILPFYLAYVVAAACYIPALIFARRIGLSLETAGTDRVNNARSAVTNAFGTALAGLVYVAIHLLYAISVSGIT